MFRKCVLGHYKIDSEGLNNEEKAFLEKFKPFIKVFLWLNTTATVAFFMIFGRTDLRKGVSEAKFDVEAAGDVKNSKISRKSRKTRHFFEKNSEKNFSTWKNRKLQIVRNAFSRSFVPIGAKFERRTSNLQTLRGAPSLANCFNEYKIDAVKLGIGVFFFNDKKPFIIKCF